jgi:hypothetical protein
VVTVPLLATSVTVMWLRVVTVALAPTVRVDENPDHAVTASVPPLATPIVASDWNPKTVVSVNVPVSPVIVGFAWKDASDERVRVEVSFLIVAMFSKIRCVDVPEAAPSVTVGANDSARTPLADAVADDIVSVRDDVTSSRAIGVVCAE